ncbi:hypothetical protein BV25DRAFT_1991428 [Artomyces pyxidatus]|uniref:Uncharacterized protein n=1 Tax=Artomyces pyxidatus TaxID=48021 RepID=A0ACB8T1A8_9AGAM|nr:hypothetical protein BV25DRAFT_1991428 [Artomyces pyxidatus]
MDIRITLSPVETTLEELGLVSALDDLDRADHTLEEHVRLAAQAVTSGDIVDKGVVGVNAAREAMATARHANVTVVETLGTALQVLDVLMKAEDAHVAFQLVWTMLSSMYKALRAQAQIKMDQDLRSLSIDLCDMLACAQACIRAYPIKGTSTVHLQVGQLATNAATLIVKKYELIGREAHAQVASHMQDCKKNLLNLQVKLVLVTIGSYLAIDDIPMEVVFTILEKLDIRQQISKLPRVPSAAYNSLHLCMPHTHVEIIDHILAWASGQDQPNLYWLSGMAGEGKTSIATSVTAYLNKRGLLGGSFFFSQDDASCAQVDNVFATLIWQLTSHREEFAKTVAEIWTHEWAEISSAHDQFYTLLCKTFTSMTLDRPVVFVLDALDQCVEGSAQRTLLLSCLRSITDLTPQCRFFFTSQPKEDIEKIFANSLIVNVSLGESTADSVEKDIALFVGEHSKQIARKYKRLQSDWPGKSAKRRIVKQSFGLFIWASEAMKFLKDSEVNNPEVQLQLLLENPPANSEIRVQSMKPSFAGLDKFYTTILDSACNEESSSAVAHLSSILGAIILIQEPLSFATFEKLLQLSSLDQDVDHGNTCNSDSWKQIQAVAPILRLDAKQTSPISILHPSLKDFLTDCTRCGDKYWIDQPKQHSQIASHCLKVMDKLLCFNICRMRDSTQLNKEIDDLIMRVEKYIPLHLKYACQYFGEHIAKASVEMDLLSQIEQFIHKNMLNWIEVLSLCECLDAAVANIEALMLWIQKHPESENLIYLLTVTKDLLTSYWKPITASALQVHTISHLPQTLQPSSQSHISIQQNHLGTDTKASETNYWPQHLAVQTGHTSRVNAVVYSPNGTQIASISNDKTIKLWNADTGKIVSQSLQGHTDWVTAVAYSPDGIQIASGSADMTIRLWNAKTGKAMGQPLIGHTDTVTTIAFSPDGKQIASGSHDATVRLWNAQTREAVGHPLEGHSDFVTAVAYSPDGTRIASGSDDVTIRLWNAQTGEAVRKPFRGHARHIHVVAFYPDGSRIVSGSYDNTIKLWNVKTGKMVGQLLYNFQVGYYDRLSISQTILLQLSSHISGSALTSLDLLPNWFKKLRNDGWVLGPKSQRLWYLPPDGRYIAIDMRGTCFVLGSYSGAITIIDASKILSGIETGFSEQHENEETE